MLRIGRLLLILLLTVSSLYMGLLVWVHFSVSPSQPAGQFVVLDKHWLHLSCRGRGEPVVLFESAFGADGQSSWDDISRTLSRTTKTCYYDRLGQGWSSAQPPGFTTQQHVDLLHQVINEVAPQQQVILVGHALGGIVARQYANQYADKIHALVMVNSSHEQQHEKLAGWLQPMSADQAYWAKISAVLGLTKIRNWFQARQIESPAEQRMLMRRASVEFADARLNLAREGGLFTSLDAQNYQIQDIPMVVLEHDPSVYADEPRWQEANAIWHDMQQEIASLSDHTEHRIAEGSGHNIPKDRPDAVVEAVKAVF